jgi:hypothetical protein
MKEQLKTPIYGRTHILTDRNKLPDVVDFSVTKGIPHDITVAKSCFDPSSDHSPILITLTTHALNQEKQPRLSSRRTNWDDFRHLINEGLNLNFSLEVEENIEAAVKLFNSTIHNGQV